MISSLGMQVLEPETYGIPVPPLLTIYLGQILNHSVPQFPHLESGNLRAPTLGAAVGINWADDCNEMKTPRHGENSW